MKKRKSSASSLAEMSCGLMVLFPVMLFLFDVAVMFLAVQTNDQCAREAGRIAASGDPALAVQRATTVITRTNQDSSGLVSKFRLVGLTFNPSNLLATESGLVPYGGTISGNVTVVTSVSVKPFLIPLAYNSNGTFDFKSAQTFPFTYNVPNTASSAVVP